MEYTPFHLNVKSHPESLKRIRTLVTDAVLGFGVPDKETASIILAVDEVCSNIIRHGYGNDASQEISVTVFPQADELVIQIFDSGVPFDINTAAPRDPTEIKPGGLGIYIIKQVMDRVEYGKTKAGLNRTRLIKKL